MSRIEDLPRSKTSLINLFDYAKLGVRSILWLMLLRSTPMTGFSFSAQMVRALMLPETILAPNS